MNNKLHKMIISLIACTFIAYSTSVFSIDSSTAEEQVEEVEKGSHGGRLLKDDDFILELSIFETGVPPEFRVWITDKNQPLQPAEVNLKVTLTRLGGVKDEINFIAQSDFLRGDSVIYEPHSFVITIDAQYKGQSHQWQYDNFEGRTTIDDAVADALAIETSFAGPALLKETISVYGKLTAAPESVRNIRARFAGSIKKVHVALGQSVKKGDALIDIESNESLKTYTIFAPIDGVIQARNANAGEQSKGDILLSLVNTRVLTSELAVFPSDIQRVALGAKAWLSIKGIEGPVLATVKQIDGALQSNQSVIVRAQVDNQQGLLLAGAFLSADIEVAEHQVPLAVRRSGLQAFRDFTVVFAKIGNEYEVRMLELGRVAGEWVEVLGGLEPGTEYVSENSYIIKADIEKSGASHDH
jgi:cobalt-zinc-cadmium efflux system membrane fusion protein